MIQECVLRRRTMCIGLATGLAASALSTASMGTIAYAATDGSRELEQHLDPLWAAAQRLGLRAQTDLNAAQQARARMCWSDRSPPSQAVLSEDFRAGRTLRLGGAVLSQSEVGWFLTVAVDA